MPTVSVTVSSAMGIFCFLTLSLSEGADFFIGTLKGNRDHTTLERRHEGRTEHMVAVTTTFDRPSQICHLASRLAFQTVHLRMAQPKCIPKRSITYRAVGKRHIPFRIVVGRRARTQRNGNAMNESRQTARSKGKWQRKRKKNTANYANRKQPKRQPCDSQHAAKHNKIVAFQQMACNGLTRRQLICMKHNLQNDNRCRLFSIVLIVFVVLIAK